MKNIFLASAMLAASLIVAGCNNAPTANKAGPAAPANTAAPAAPAGNGVAPAPGGEAGADQTNQNFTITNNTGHVLTTLNVSASNDNAWGPDILGRDVLANGESAEITFPRAETACMWDIRATYDDGGTSDNRGVNLCETTTVSMVSQ
jgi:hypothetical protein